MPVLYTPAAKTSEVASSGRLIRPAAEALAHLGGYVLRGPIGHQRFLVPSADTGEVKRLYTYRHTNCDYLMLWCLVGDAGQSASATVTLKAGGGATTSINAHFAGVGSHYPELQLIAPWDSADTGYQEVVIAGNDVSFADWMLFEVYREELNPLVVGGTTDDCVHGIDNTYTLGGLGEGQYIIESTEAGAKGLITQTENLWVDGLKNCAVWSGAGILTTSSSFANPFTDGTTPYVFRHIARKKVNEATRDYRFYVYYTTTVTAVGEVKLTSSVGSDTVTVAALSGGPAWAAAGVGLAVSTGAVDSLTFEFRRASGAGNFVVTDISILEDT